MILGKASTAPSPPPSRTATPGVGSTSVQRISQARDRRQDRHLQRKWYFIFSDALALFTATFFANAVSLYLWKPLGWALVEEVFSLRSLGMTALLTLCWVSAITICRGYSHQARSFPSIGRECVLKGSLCYFAALACVDGLSSYGLFRQFALMAVPVGLILMIVSRYLSRR